MKDKLNIEKLIKNIRENGVKVYIVSNNKSNNLTQLDVRIMIENNLDNIKKESKQANNFAEILEQLKDVIEFKEENKMKNKINKEEIFNQIKQNGCKCYLYGNKNNSLTQSDLIKTIENNKERIINGKIGNSFADVIQDKNNE